jgi:hypothetical protein
LLTCYPSCPSVFPIFEKRGTANEGTEEKKPFRWLTPSLGPTRSCLHGVHLAPAASERVAAFDLDGTVIKSQFIQVGRAGSKGGASVGKRTMKGQTGGLEWEWWRAVVPQKLKEAHDSGCAHILVPFPPLFLLFSERLLLSSIDSTMHHATSCHGCHLAGNTHRIHIDGQVLCRIDLESMPQVLGAHGLEEKDSADRYCRASSTPRAASFAAIRSSWAFRA